MTLLEVDPLPTNYVAEVAQLVRPLNNPVDANSQPIVLTDVEYQEEEDR